MTSSSFSAKGRGWFSQGYAPLIGYGRETLLLSLSRSIASSFFFLCASVPFIYFPAFLRSPIGRSVFPPFSLAEYVANTSAHFADDLRYGLPTTLFPSACDGRARFFACHVTRAFFLNRQPEARLSSWSGVVWKPRAASSSSSHLTALPLFLIAFSARRIRPTSCILLFPPLDDRFPPFLFTPMRRSPRFFSIAVSTL